MLIDLIEKADAQGVRNGDAVEPAPIWQDRKHGLTTEKWIRIIRGVDDAGEA